MLTISQQADRLGRLVGQLLDISRLESGKIQLSYKEVNLTQLIEGVVADIQAALPPDDPQRIEVECSDNLTGQLDPLRIEQVLTNLVNNAIKYSPEGGSVWVAAELVEPGGILKVSVTDQGLGIAPENRARLFERFYQAHPGSLISGMGLGLYISRQLIELHGGQIKAEFPAEGDTCFVVTLPVEPPEQK